MSQQHLTLQGSTLCWRLPFWILNSLAHFDAHCISESEIMTVAKSWREFFYNIGAILKHFWQWTLMKSKCKHCFAKVMNIIRLASSVVRFLHKLRSLLLHELWTLGCLQSRDNLDGQWMRGLQSHVVHSKIWAWVHHWISRTLFTQTLSRINSFQPDAQLINTLSRATEC